MENNTSVIVTDANYTQVVEGSDKPVLLAIGAPWCGDCRRLQPLWMQFAQQYGDKLLFASCNFDDNAQTIAKFNVRHIPTFCLIKNGTVLDTLVEPKSIAPFKQFVEKATEQL